MGPGRTVRGRVRWGAGGGVVYFPLRLVRASAREEAAGVFGGEVGDFIYREGFDLRDRFARKPDILRLVPRCWVLTENRRIRFEEEPLQRKMPHQFLLLRRADDRRRDREVVAKLFPGQGGRGLPIEGVQQDLLGAMF